MTRTNSRTKTMCVALATLAACSGAPSDEIAQTDASLGKIVVTAQNQEYRLEGALGITGDFFSTVLSLNGPEPTKTADVPFGSYALALNDYQLYRMLPAGQRDITGRAGLPTINPNPIVVGPGTNAVSIEFADMNAVLGTGQIEVGLAVETRICDGEFTLDPQTASPGTEVQVNATGFFEDVVEIVIDDQLVGGSNQPQEPYQDHFYVSELAPAAYRVELVGLVSGLRKCAWLVVTAQGG
jgi:hypothetical protein